MEKEKLYEFLDIESPVDFEYFENIAALLECDEDISYDDMFELISQVDTETLIMLIDNYFEEISDYIPGESAEFYTLMEQIRLSLTGLARSSDEENVMANLVEEIDRFRRWYSSESKVICTPIGSAYEEEQTLRDALYMSRLEKIDGDRYSYDFSQCIDYHLDEYIMSFADVAAAAEEPDDAE